MCGASSSDSAWLAQARQLAAERQAEAQRQAEMAQAVAEAEAADELEAVKAVGLAEVDRVLAQIQDRHPAFSR